MTHTPQPPHRRNKTIENDYTDFTDYTDPTYDPYDPYDPYDHSASLGPSPADLIASVPGVLGYFPQESVLVIQLSVDEYGDAVALGPVLRADLGNTEGMLDELCRLPSSGPVVNTAVIVSRIPNSPLVLDMVEDLCAARYNDGAGTPLIDACWHVSEIAAGTPYSLVFGPPMCEDHCADLPRDMVSGTVASVVSQPTMQPLLAQGALPELDRSDTRAFFDPEPTPDAGAAGTQRLFHRGNRIYQLLQADPATASATLRHACRLLEEAEDLPLIGAPHATRLCPQDRNLLAALLTRPALRDCLLGTIITHPNAAAGVLLDIARTSEGVIRANALSLWALAAVRLRLAPWASAALECAQDEVPEHSLSYILAQLLRGGEHSNLLRAAQSGCSQTWEELGGWPDDL